MYIYLYFNYFLVDYEYCSYLLVIYFGVEYWMCCGKVMRYFECDVVYCKKRLSYFGMCLFFRFWLLLSCSVDLCCIYFMIKEVIFWGGWIMFYCYGLLIGYWDYRLLCRWWVIWIIKIIMVDVLKEGFS